VEAVSTCRKFGREMIKKGGGGFSYVSPLENVVGVVSRWVLNADTPEYEGADSNGYMKKQRTKRRKEIKFKGIP